MNTVPDKSPDFKYEVGRLILIGAIAYCALVTLGMFVSTIWMIELSQTVRDFMMIILTWFTTKAGTVIDHQYGSSAGSEDKTKFQEKQLEEKENVAKNSIQLPGSAPFTAPVDSIVGGVRGPSNDPTGPVPSNPAEPIV